MKNFGGYFDIDSKEKEIIRLEKETIKEDFWSDRKQAESIIEELNNMKQFTSDIKLLRQKINDNLDFILNFSNEEAIDILGIKDFKLYIKS